MKEKLMTKDIYLRVPIEIFNDLNEIAKRESRPRSYVMREMIETGIRHKKLNQAVKDVMDEVRKG